MNNCDRFNVFVCFVFSGFVEFDVGIVLLRNVRTGEVMLIDLSGWERLINVEWCIVVIECVMMIKEYIVEGDLIGIYSCGFVVNGIVCKNIFDVDLIVIIC